MGFQFVGFRGVGYHRVGVKGRKCGNEAPKSHYHREVLGGSWVVTNGLISPLIWVISILTLLITLLITTHEPPSMQEGLLGRTPEWLSVC